MPAQKERDESVRQYGLDFSEEESDQDDRERREKLERYNIRPATSRPDAAIRGERVQQRPALIAFLARQYRKIRRLLRH